MLRSALRWLRIDQNDQIAASLMCSCVVLARSDRRPAGAGTHWTLGNVVAPEQSWTIDFGQGIPRTHHELEKPGHRAAHDSAGDEPPTATARTAHSTAASSDLAQRDSHRNTSAAGTGQHSGGSWATAKQGMQLERSGVSGSSSTELRRHHLRQ